jgi:hypothetical protein
LFDFVILNNNRFNSGATLTFDFLVDSNYRKQYCLSPRPLCGSAVSANLQEAIINMSGYKKNDQLLDKTSDVQDKALKSLDRTRATVLKAEESGNATLEKLHEQGNQMVTATNF